MFPWRIQLPPIEQEYPHGNIWLTHCSSRKNIVETLGTQWRKLYEAVVLLYFLIRLRKNSCYPETEQNIPRPCLLSIPPLKNVKRSEKEVEEMRDYSRAYGAAVRQRTNRQETTMHDMEQCRRLSTRGICISQREWMSPEWLKVMQLYGK